MYRSYFNLTAIFVCSFYLAGCNNTTSPVMAAKYKAATASKYVYKEPNSNTNTFTIEFQIADKLALINNLESPHRYDNNNYDKLNFKIGKHELMFEGGTIIFLNIQKNGTYKLVKSGFNDFKVENTENGEIVLYGALKQNKNYNNTIDYIYTPTYVGHGKWY
jgi:hypothetical protein